MKSTALILISLLLFGCGGDTNSDGPGETIPPADTTTYYTHSNGSLYEVLISKSYSASGFYYLLIPTGSNINFTVNGGAVDVYDINFNFIENFNSRERDQMYLDAGEYMVYLSSASSNFQVSVYSPALLNPALLPSLSNGSYPSSGLYTRYYSLTMPIDGAVSFQASNSTVTLYDIDLNMFAYSGAGLGFNGSSINLLAGTYVVKFQYGSTNYYEFVVTSSVL